MSGTFPSFANGDSGAPTFARLRRIHLTEHRNNTKLAWTESDLQGHRNTLGLAICSCPLLKKNRWKFNLVIFYWPLFTVMFSLSPPNIWTMNLANPGEDGVFYEASNKTLWDTSSKGLEKIKYLAGKTTANIIHVHHGIPYPLVHVWNIYLYIYHMF